MFIPPDYNVSVTDWERSLRLRWAPAPAVTTAEGSCHVASAALLQGLCRKHQLVGAMAGCDHPQLLPPLPMRETAWRHLGGHDRLHQQAVPPRSECALLLL